MTKIVFCGGGSAGHVVPNIAVIERLPENYEYHYVGTDGIEKSICKQSGVPFTQFNGVKLVRGKIFCNLLIPAKLFKSVQRCKKILKELNPSLLFCKGGYASLPPALAASSLHVPIIIHESDVSMGLANKLIARKAKLVLSSFPQTVAGLNNGVCCGSPIRKGVFYDDRAQAKKKLNLDHRPTILVFGGGNGSCIINDTLRKIILPICQKYNVVHVCGKGNTIKCNIYGYVQFEFCNDMGIPYACADYAVSRCGSNSAFELIARKIPTLFIPLNNGASRGDQVQNANYFYKKGLCRVLDERNLTAEQLKIEIEKLILDDKLKAALRDDDTQCGTDNAINAINSVVKN